MLLVFVSGLGVMEVIVQLGIPVALTIKLKEVDLLSESPRTVMGNDPVGVVEAMVKVKVEEQVGLGLQGLLEKVFDTPDGKGVDESIERVTG